MISIVFEVTAGDLAEVSNAMKAFEVYNLEEEPKYRCIREVVALISETYGPDSSPTRDKIISQAAEYFKLLQIQFYKTEKVRYEDMLVFLKEGDQACIRNSKFFLLRKDSCPIACQCWTLKIHLWQANLSI